MNPTANTSRNPTFLTAEWRNLAMINYECDPALLASRKPRGTELDFWNGKAYVSMVGFSFLRTRVLGVPIPFHCNFEEVNLRFYVRRKIGGEIRRGVVFVRELVPRAAIAWVARNLYEEPYQAVPMSHRIHHRSGVAQSVEYSWRFKQQPQHLKVELEAGTRDLLPDTHEEFIAEHYWGDTARSNGTTSEYEVVHAPWQIQNATSSELSCDIAGLYGADFIETLNAPPASAFLALGSPVSVQRGRPLRS